ncbi:hypothetical protein C8J56DRAFT_1025900 [Mycena floridula]|nr:hypothetical protein C8J56DRAFT_1025900 [Mycena floridula]
MLTAKLILAAFSALIAVQPLPELQLYDVKVKETYQEEVGKWLDFKALLSRIFLLDERGIRMDPGSAERKVPQLTIWTLERRSTLFVGLSFVSAIIGSEVFRDLLCGMEQLTNMNMKEDEPPAHLGYGHSAPWTQFSHRAGSAYSAPRRTSLPRAAQEQQTPHHAGFGMPRRRRSAYPAPRIGIPTIASAFVVPSQMVYPLTDPTRLDLAPAYSATCETRESIPKLNREREQEALAQ